jgi:hypothetical protein
MPQGGSGESGGSNARIDAIGRLHVFSQKAANERFLCVVQTAPRAVVALGKVGRLAAQEEITDGA